MKSDSLKIIQLSESLTMDHVKSTQVVEGSSSQEQTYIFISASITNTPHMVYSMFKKNVEGVYEKNTVVTKKCKVFPLHECVRFRLLANI